MKIFDNVTENVRDDMEKSIRKYRGADRVIYEKSMIIQKAKPEEFQTARLFYHTLIDDLKNAAYRPGWQKDIYPDPEELKAEITAGNFYCGYVANELASCMVINHRFQDDAYAEAKWETKATAEEVLVIHILGVGSRFARKGLAKQMVRFAIDTAEKTGMKAVRLDVMKGNLPAERLYPQMGFHYRNTVPMYYPDVGWMEFELYEYVVQE